MDDESLVDDAKERVESLRSTAPGAYELARVLSLAARVERGLVRRARVSLIDADAAAEADLWASEVVMAQTPQGFVFEPRAAEVLRAHLASDPLLLEKAWRFVAAEHREAPWPVRAEELILQLTAATSPDHAERAQEVLVAATQRMVESGDRASAAQWVMRALMRLPASVGQSPVARIIHAGVGAQIDGRLQLEGDMPADSMENWLPWLLSNASARVDVRVAFGDGVLEFDAPSSTRTRERVEPAQDVTRGAERRARGDAPVVSVPETSPVLLDLRWHDGMRAHARRMELERGAPTRVAVNADQIEIRAIDGTRHLVRRAGARPGRAGFDYSAIRSRHRPFVGREDEIKELDAVLGDHRVTAIIGPEGFGKTALLCRYLDLIESRGEQAVVHFLEGGPESWRNARTTGASLLAQLEALRPGDRRATEREVDFSERVWRSKSDRPLYVLLDGVPPSWDDEEVLRWVRLDLHATARARPAQGPDVRVLYTATAPFEELRDQHVLRLAERTRSNDEVCREYLELHRPELARALAAPPESSRPRIWLASSRADHELAAQVRRVAMGLGANVRDTSSFVVGERWRERIAEEVRDADACIVIATAEARYLEFLAREVALMFELGKRVLPITTDVTILKNTEVLSPLLRFKALELPPDRDLDAVLRASLEPFLWANLGDRLARAEELLLKNGGGVIGRVAATMAWIRSRPEGSVRIEQIPPTLYGGFDAAWDDAVPAEEGLEGSASGVAALLAAAREELAVSVVSQLVRVEADAMDEVLSSLAGHGLVASRAAAQHAAREPGRPDEIEAVQYVALADESLREPITQRIGERQMRVWHTMLAEHPDEDYRLRHRLRHLTDAGANYTAREEANDVRWLARICNALGVDTLEAQLAYVHASVPPTDHTADAALR